MRPDRPARPEQNHREERERNPERNRAPARGHFSWLAGGVLLLLLVAPLLALYRLGALVGVWWVLGGWAVLSLATYTTYAGDKRKAEAGAWRTPENTLHLLEFAGGWPAAFVAQRKLRHKISKGSYQFAFWSIVLVHQAAATDFLLDWQFTRMALGDKSVSGKEVKAEPPIAPVAGSSTPKTGPRISVPPPPKSNSAGKPRAGAIHAGQKKERGASPKAKKDGKERSVR